MEKKVPAEKRDGCEEPCAYGEQADARIERSPPSPRRCSPQPGYTAHDPRVTKETKGQDNGKISHAGEDQAEADHAEN